MENTPITTTRNGKIYFCLTCHHPGNNDFDLIGDVTDPDVGVKMIDHLNSEKHQEDLAHFWSMVIPKMRRGLKPEGKYLSEGICFITSPSIYNHCECCSVNGKNPNITFLEEDLVEHLLSTDHLHSKREIYDSLRKEYSQTRVGQSLSEALKSLDEQELTPLQVLTRIMIITYGIVNTGNKDLLDKFLES